MSVVDLADARFARAVERLPALGPRPLLEMLVELAATRLLRTEIEQAVARDAGINPATLAAVGGDRPAPAPIHLISDRLDAALGHLREAESRADDDSIILHELGKLGLAIEDARDLATDQGCAS